MSQPATEHYRIGESVSDIVISLGAKKLSPQSATRKDVEKYIRKEMEEDAGMPRLTVTRILRGYNRAKDRPSRPSPITLALFCTVLGGNEDDYKRLLCAAYPEMPIILDVLAQRGSTGGPRQPAPG